MSVVASYPHWLTRPGSGVAPEVQDQLPSGFSVQAPPLGVDGGFGSECGATPGTGCSLRSGPAGNRARSGVACPARSDGPPPGRKVPARYLVFPNCLQTSNTQISATACPPGVGQVRRPPPKRPSSVRLLSPNGDLRLAGRTGLASVHLAGNFPDGARCRHAGLKEVWSS